MKKTTQMNLDSFLKTNNKRKQFFYIDWNVANPLATWLIKKPKDVSFSCTVKWYHVGDIIICCKNKDSITDESNELMLQNIEKINSKLFDEKRQLLSFMKSHLQKCIRRQKGIETLKSAKELLLLDKNEFLRRISIIMFEDVKLKLYFVNFVWLMVACSKGYKIEEYHLDYIFKYTYDMVCEKNIDTFNYEDKCIEKNGVDKFLDKVNVNKNISDENKDILYCIGLRISYGGMGGDIDMLCYYAQQYFYFFEENGKSIKNFDTELCKDINAKYVFGLHFEKIEDFICNGVDYHCFPGIIKDIKEDIGYKYSDEQLKTCIWEYNSKTNTRKDNQIDESKISNIKNIWEDINKVLYKHQLIILEMMLKKLKE
jgi:hypothetical protein